MPKAPGQTDPTQANELNVERGAINAKMFCRMTDTKRLMETIKMTMLVYDVTEAEAWFATGASYALDGMVEATERSMMEAQEPAKNTIAKINALPKVL